ncbi:hypothetical protein PgNI_06570 [Pyricularia grisea]|uniref:Uncharacterized protein n=1 Tax=Pyricularia grisea TaxID=148305 RepID=A0A6P8B5X5_PYRGI|nr:hypothetical protein PgNI_06570 [Pyricularia grisea]TLD10707.1 hypothetical protein PgNI_06570 [Pyricularia grisea]
MTRFEVAGFVFGAFPIAVTAINGYPKIARKVEALEEIRVAYTRCFENLENEQLTFKRHLRTLVSALVFDSVLAKAPLADPSGKLRKLSESHELDLSYIRRMEEMLAELSRETALDSNLVREKMEAQAEIASSRCKSLNKITPSSTFTKQSFFTARTIANVYAQTLKSSVSIFLITPNQFRVELLASNEKDIQLTQQLEASLWKLWQTTTVFLRALAAACRCPCFEDHATRLFLQYRLNYKDITSFELVFTGQPGVAQSSHVMSWQPCPTRIQEDNEKEVVKKRILRVEPQEDIITRLLSAKICYQGKTSYSARRTAATFHRGQSQIFGDYSHYNVGIPPESPSDALIRKIQNLCESLCGLKTDHREYFNLPDEKKRYHVFSIFQT